MKGIDLNKPIVYKTASLRIFDKNDHHVTRLCKEDVLLLVFEGVLRFEEENKIREVHPGEYYIQKKNTYQTGNIASDSPQYMYIHFLADWTEEDTALPRQGDFDHLTLKPLAEELNQLSHNQSSLFEQTMKFFEILSILSRSKTKITLANKIADFISKNHRDVLNLEMIAEEFNFSKNHIINVFKKQYKMTPIEYMNHLKIRQAEQLLEVTSRPVEDIYYECGFNNYQHFYKSFYRANGVSPTEWRHQKRLRPAEKVISGYSNADTWDVFPEAAWMNCIMTGPLPTVRKGDVLQLEVDMSLSTEKEVEIKDIWKIARLNLRLYDYTDNADAIGEKVHYYGDMYNELEEKIDPVYSYTYRTLTSTLKTTNFSDTYMYALNHANGIKAIVNDSQVSQASGNRVTRHFYRVAVINKTTGETLYEITGQELFDKLAKALGAIAIKATPLPPSGHKTATVR